MKRIIGQQRQKAIMLDMLTAQHDIAALAQRYGLDEIDLANFALTPVNHRRLMGLCVLADVQTQLVLSRYRAMAASRLIQLATNQESDSELARKACVDLLRLDMKRAEAPPTEDDEAEPASLRELLYGEAKSAEQSIGDQSNGDAGTTAPSPSPSGEGLG